MEFRRVLFRSEHIETEANRVPFDLDVTFLEDVEQSHLDLRGEVGKLVDGEDPPMSARQEAVVDRQLVRQIESASRRTNGVEISDDIRDSHIRSGKFFDVTLLATEPMNGSLIS